MGGSLWFSSIPRNREATAHHCSTRLVRIYLGAVSPLLMPSQTSFSIPEGHLRPTHSSNIAMVNSIPNEWIKPAVIPLSLSKRHLDHLAEGDMRWRCRGQEKRLHGRTLRSWNIPQPYINHANRVKVCRLNSAHQQPADSPLIGAAFLWHRYSQCARHNLFMTSSVIEFSQVWATTRKSGGDEVRHHV